MTGRLSYRKVLGSKNPSDVLTKHVPADLLDKHLATIKAKIVGGRAELAPELNVVESVVEWYEFIPDRQVSFARKVEFRAIPSQNKGRPCRGTNGDEKWHRPRGSTAPRGTTSSGTKAAQKADKVVLNKVESSRWADWTDDEENLERESSRN